MHARVALGLVALLVPLAAAADGLPDLTGGALPGWTVPDRETPVFAFVENDCDTAAGAVDARVDVDGAFFGTVHIDFVDACEGWGLIEAGRATFTEGIHTFRLTVDPEDLVRESDESNNVRELARYFGPGSPDVVPSIREIHTTGWPATRVTVDYSVCNTGDAPMGAGTEVWVLLQTTTTQVLFGPTAFGLIEETLAPELAPGACLAGVVDTEPVPDVGRATAAVWLHTSDESPYQETGDAWKNNQVERRFFLGPDPGTV